MLNETKFARAKADLDKLIVAGESGDQTATTQLGVLIALYKQIKGVLCEQPILAEALQFPELGDGVLSTKDFCDFAASLIMQANDASWSVPEACEKIRSAIYQMADHPEHASKVFGRLLNFENN